MANEYVTSSELKSTLSLTGESFADADITLALTAASRGIDHVTERRFWADSGTANVRYYSPTAADRAWIDDLVTCTEVAVDPGGDGTFEEAWTLNTDYLLEPLNAAADGWPWTSLCPHPRSSRYFPVGHPRSLRVTGKFGWNAVPEPIKEATGIIASKLVKRKREAPFGVVGFGAEGIAVRIAQNDPDVQFLIGPYVRTNHSTF